MVFREWLAALFVSEVTKALWLVAAGKFLEGVKWGDDGSLQQRIAGQGYKQARSIP